MTLSSLRKYPVIICDRTIIFPVNSYCFKVQTHFFSNSVCIFPKEQKKSEAVHILFLLCLTYTVDCRGGGFVSIISYSSPHELKRVHTLLYFEIFSTWSDFIQIKDIKLYYSTYTKFFLNIYTLIRQHFYSI